MTVAKGTLIRCDYPTCKQEVFLEQIGVKNADGGYTTYIDYEPKPEGWGIEQGKDLCPDHYQYYQDMLNEFWNPVEPDGQHATGITGELAKDIEADDTVVEPEDDFIAYTNMPEMNVKLTGPTGTVEGAW